MPRDNSMPSTLADMAALGKLWEEHLPKLLAMVRRRIDPSLAVRIDPEAILNDAFLDACRRWARFKEQRRMTPYAWLYRIVLDRLIETWRQETRGPRDLRRDVPLPEGTSIQLAMGLLSHGTSPSSALAREELREQVRQVLARLKDADREILWMRHHDELSYKEIAAVLDIQENAATQRYHRALGRLSDLWLSLHPAEGSSHA